MAAKTKYLVLRLKICLILKILNILYVLAIGNKLSKVLVILSINREIDVSSPARNGSKTLHLFVQKQHGINHPQ